MDLTVMRAMTTKTLAALFVTIMGIAMILPSNLAIASTEDDGSTDDGSEVQDDGSTDEGTTEDDGWIEGDDDSQGEVSNQDELEKTYEDTPWEDNVGPNDFKEATNNDDNDESRNKVVHETTVIQSASASASVTAIAAEVSSCKVDGSANGIQQKFDTTEY
jgi:hypothetical protein